MDPITAKLMAAAGAAKEATYVDDVFSTFLHEGTGSAQTITNGIDISGEGGMVIIKNRPRSIDGFFTFDTERGTNKYIRTNLANAEQTSTSILTAFSSTGFSIGTSGSSNRSGDGYVSWTFRKCPGFFDVVTYTGTGSVQNISHSLGSAPGSIWIKPLSSSGAWTVTHRSTGWNYYLELNENLLAQQDSQFSSIHNSTAPTASVFTLGNSGAVNASGTSYVAYIFAHDDQSFGDDGDEAIIKCGSYTGNGTSSNSVTLGFEPQWLLVKDSSSTNNWGLYDTMRGITTGGNDPYLMPDIAQYEDGDFNLYSVTPTGFEAVSSNQFVNGNNQTYIYIAIRRPHKPPSAGTEVLGINDLSTPQNVWTPGFATDTLFVRRYGSVDDTRVAARLIGNTKFLATNSTNSESSDGTSYYHFDDPTGTIHQTYLQGGSNTINYAFKRAPGFFDVVTYTGTGSARTVNHNLGVAPELMIVKQRDGGSYWAVYSSALGATKYLQLNGNNAEGTSVAVWNNTSPTSSVFTVNYAGAVNGSGNEYIAYLFASLDGISKIGTYTGTGSARNLDFGFTAGARFFLFKRTDDSQNWGLFDTGRGITAGDDYFITLNESGAQLTGDYVDPYSAGISLPGSVANNSGATFIYLAIA